MESTPITIGQLTFDHAEYDHDYDIIYLYNGHRFPFDNDVETVEGHMVCSPHPGPDADDDPLAAGHPWLDPQAEDGPRPAPATTTTNPPWPDPESRLPGPRADAPELAYDPGRALDRPVPQPDPTELEPEINGLALLAPRQHVRERGRVLLTLPTAPPRIIQIGPTKIEAIIATAEPVNHRKD